MKSWFAGIALAVAATVRMSKQLIRSQLLGNSVKELNETHFIPFFIGILLGIDGRPRRHEGDEVADVGNRDRIDASERFIEQDEFRIGRERTSDLR